MRAPFLILECPAVDPLEVRHQMVELEGLFKPSRVYQETERVIAPRHRHSYSLSHHPVLTKIGEQIFAYISQRKGEILPQLSLDDFDVGSLELSCTCYVDGMFFTRHHDYTPLIRSNRVYTWSYYFFKEPKLFTGGALAFYEKGLEIARIDPSNGLLLLFRSDSEHAVEKVQLPSNLFCDARFVITGFVGQKPNIGTEAARATRLLKLWARPHYRQLKKLFS